MTIRISILLQKLRKSEENKLKKELKQYFEEDLDMKIQRLKFINALTLANEIEGREFFSSPIPSYWFYEEAIKCYLQGNFIATIILSQNALEERLRTFFRIIQPRKKFSTGNNDPDSARFYDLINEALHVRLISPNEADSLHHLRKNLRNQYVHTKDDDSEVLLNVDGSMKEYSMSGSDILNMKIKSKLVAKDTQDEAKEALVILFEVYNAISRRSPVF
ncbi:MAG: hypothetical protein R2685_16240 [Candidatus Nitrosocosmicus sp.]|nr:hypothetical protein [Candidatus Nitrosocosmicus sp.]